MNFILNPLAAKAHSSHTMGLQWAPAYTTTSRSQHRAPDHTTTSSWACIEPQSQSSLAPQAQNINNGTPGQFASLNDIHTSGDCFSTVCERPFLWSNWIRPTLRWLKKILRHTFCCLSSGDTTICWYRDRLSSDSLFQIPLEEEDISPTKCLEQKKGKYY